MTLKSQLHDLQPIRPDVEDVKHAGWHNHGILVVSVDDQRLDWVQRAWVEQIGKLLYGKDV